ncbi:hypothetical protein T5B8_02495 [Salinisphaera sp. T5B8]|uniref:hypothetical protein n=1 Tax=Salinisphaera sp. T5B8 TaxID=1304154 RepID=UPI00334086C0
MNAGKKAQILCLLVATFGHVSCASNAPRESRDVEHGGGGALAGLATVSALMVALPLIPFVETYDWINNTDEKRRAKRRALAAHFAPIYAERTRRIRARAPKADANQLADRGVHVLLPSTPGGVVYPGLAHDRWADVDHERNADKIAADPLAVELMQLMAPDAVQDEHAESHYSGQAWRDFIDAYFDYKTAFNEQMLARCEQQLPRACER